jgi:hypothetical protein
MAVQDDLRRLSQGDSIYLGFSVFSYTAGFATPTNFVSWFKGRLQQSNDGNWIFRSVSTDRAVVGFQLGAPNPTTWSSSENPNTGISVFIQINLTLPNVAGLQSAAVFLQQQLPQELTN